MFSRQTFETVGKMLKDARVISGLSQRDVSLKLGYTSPQFISNIERGLCMPPLKQLKVMVSMYGLDAVQVAEMIIESQSDSIRSQLGITQAKKKVARAGRR